MVDAPSEEAAVRGPDVSADMSAEPPQRKLRRGRRATRALIGLSLLMIGYLGVTFWQVWHASRTDSPRPSAAIVVLGAAQYDGRPSPALEARLETALELYRAGVAPLIVTTGSNQAGDRFTEAAAGVAYLRSRGVPDVALLAVAVGTNTWEELEATAARLRRDGRSTKVVLVSDPYHAYRVDKVASEVGLDGAVVSTSGSASFGRLLRETAGASIGRFVGYEALARLG